MDNELFARFCFQGKQKVANLIRGQMTDKQREVFDLYKDGMTVNEIVKFTGTPQPTVYDMISKLRTKGYVK